MLRSFLQTKAWLDFQSRAGHGTWHFNDGGIRANIIKHGSWFGKSYLYIPHGPEIAVEAIYSGIRNEIGRFVTHLKQLAQEQSAMFVKMEPLTDAVVELLYANGMKLKHSSKTVQPHKTLVLDLASPDLELLGQMHHKTRYNIGLAEKKGLSFQQSGNVDAFWKLMLKTTKHDGFSSHPKEYYEKLLQISGELQTTLFLVSWQDRPVAGMIALAYDDTAYFLHGAMDRECRSTMAPYLMHWEAIKYFKERGYKCYDFWGIDATRWPGVTRFKLGFGGTVVEYPGSFDLPISKFWYFVYRVARKIF